MSLNSQSANTFQHRNMNIYDSVEYDKKDFGRVWAGLDRSDFKQRLSAPLYLTVLVAYKYRLWKISIRFKSNGKMVVVFYATMQLNFAVALKREWLFL